MIVQIRLMGTGASEGWPAVWCGCDVCEKARRLGGKNLRTRSGALIDDDLKIDLPPDMYGQSLRDGVRLSAVRNVLITHTHGDHFYPDELVKCQAPYSYQNEVPHIWGNEWAIAAIKARVPTWPREDALHVLRPYEPVMLGDTRVLPLRAAHGGRQEALNFIIEREGKTVLYGQDSGYFPEDSWQAQVAFKFDLVVLDCTYGPNSGDSAHGGYDIVLTIKQRMLENGTADASTVFVANHFSHNGGLLHEELVAHFAPHEIEVAFDGMVIHLA